MLADTIVKRWQDHLPLHRLEGVYARDGLELARSTMCCWHDKGSHTLGRLLLSSHQPPTRSIE
jgi:transposase